MKEKQEPPFAIQIELTEGCNLFCKFCGIRGIRSKPGQYNFLTLATAKKIAKRISESKWTARIEIAMHGEPTLNPNFIPIISILRKYLPNNQIMMTTNGYGFIKMPKVIVNRAFYAGLNILAIDAYNHNPFWKKIYKKVPGEFYPDEAKSPHLRHPKKTRKVIYIQDIKSATHGGHSVLNNHCGCAFPPLRKPMPQRCAKPFREMSIRWDGNIAICCNDWRGHYFCGNILNDRIEKIWNNEAFSIARKTLYHRSRDFIPCKWCDAKSSRIGFLPDKKGQRELPRPTRKELKKLKQIGKEDQTLTTIVKRKWEK